MYPISVAILLLASFSSAIPVAATSIRRQSGSTACAQIAESYSSLISSPSQLPLRIESDLAYDCLQSLPFDEELASSFLNESLKYMNWQSTLEALTSPPDTYKSPSTDILGGFNDIATNISSGAFSSQYDFDQAIYNLVATAHDGHFALGLCSLAIFQFRRTQINLVSISTDGTKKPEIYLYGEAPLAGNSSSMVSPIITINGVPVVEFLESISSNLRAQDPDTRYNDVFPSNALNALNDPTALGAFVVNDFLWPGSAETILEHSNGTITNISTAAFVSAETFNVTDPQDVFDQFCLPAPPAASSTESASPSSPTTPTVSSSEPSFSPTFTAGPFSYPEPFIRDPYNQISGYDLQEEDLNDTVVMFIPTFSAEQVPTNQSSIFANVATQIVNQAITANKSRIIIDVSGNGGGDIVRAFDLFKLFFPEEFPYSATRFRTHESVDLLTQVLGNPFVNQSAAQAVGAVAYRGVVTPNQTTDFDSVSELLNGGEELGVQVSSLIANFNYSAQSTEDTPIRGYGAIANTFTTSPFAAENILIVGDGVCASTCTTFVNLMTNVGGVRSVVFGGRPNGDPSMQIMGGVRGGQSASWDLIDEWVADAQYVLENNSSALTAEQLERANATFPIGYENFPLRTNGGSINFRNAYQEGDDGLPLQFAYQAADCRRYFTWENIANPASVWVDAANSWWGDEGCVGGKGTAQGTASQNANSTTSAGGGNGTGTGSEGGSGSGGGGGGFSGAAVGLRVGRETLFAIILSVVVTLML